MAEYLTQPPGIGERRELRDVEKEHIVCLLRAVERLPIISEPLPSEISNGGVNEALCRRLQNIHENHLRLAEYAAAVLAESPNQ